MVPCGIAKNKRQGETLMKQSLKKTIALLCALAMGLALAAVPAAADDPLLAFPGADGMGKYTAGGRGGTVYQVTTLEDYNVSSGEAVIPGSLREAVEASGPRTIVFQVAGTIELKSNLRVRNPCLTIAGQTAPGQGITLKNYTFSITADEVIVRNIRVRCGDMSDDDGMYIGNANHVIVDHCSVSWGVDETFSIKRNLNTTVQWCFITEGLHNSVHPTVRKHSKGSLVSGNDGQVVSLHHNLWAHNDARNPRPQGLKMPDEDPVGFFCDITNNVMYDWGREYVVKNMEENGEHCTINLINNYMIAGPSSNASYMMLDRNPNTRMYFAGNYMNGKLPADQYKLITYEELTKPNNGWKLSFPFDGGMSKIDSAEQAFARVMKYGGAALHRDAVDERIVGDVLNGTGRVIDKPSDVGGWPALSTDPTWIDEAKAAWEAEYGFDPYSERGSEVAPGGYTYLELFLNALMEGLYQEDLPVPPFDNTWRWFYHILYVLDRASEDVLEWLRDAWAFVRDLFS